MNDGQTGMPRESFQLPDDRASLHAISYSDIRARVSVPRLCDFRRPYTQHLASPGCITFPRSPTAPFADKREFVDLILLKRRNAIAHGEDAFVGIEDLDYVTRETVAMMRGFGDALENSVYLESYRSA